MTGAAAFLGLRSPELPLARSLDLVLISMLAVAITATCVDGTPYEPEPCEWEVHVVPGLNGPRGDTVFVRICTSPVGEVTRDTLYRRADR